MAKYKILAGTASYKPFIFIQDATSSTGAGLASLVFNTAGLTAYYCRDSGAASTAITLATATLGTFASGGFIAADNTNMPGLYQIGLPNAALAAGANKVTVYLKGAANMVPVVLEIELDAVNYQDGAAFGLSSLPNVAAGAAGGLVKLDTAGRNNVNLLSYTTQAAGSTVVMLINGDGTMTNQLPSAFGFPAGMVSTYAGGAVASVTAAVNTNDTAAATTAYGTITSNLNAPVTSRMATSAYTAPPTDYQQRSVAVTLPTLPNVTVGSFAAGVTLPYPSVAPSWYVAPLNATDYQQRGVAVTLPAAPSGYGFVGGVVSLSTSDEAVLTSLNAMIIGNVFSGASLANSPSAGSGLQAAVTAALNAQGLLPNRAANLDYLTQSPGPLSLVAPYAIDNMSASFAPLTLSQGDAQVPWTVTLLKGGAPINLADGAGQARVIMHFTGRRGVIYDAPIPVLQVGDGSDGTRGRVQYIFSASDLQYNEPAGQINFRIEWLGAGKRLTVPTAGTVPIIIAPQLVAD